MTESKNHIHKCVSPSCYDKFPPCGLVQHECCQLQAVSEEVEPQIPKNLDKAIELALSAPFPSLAIHHIIDKLFEKHQPQKEVQCDGCGICQPQKEVKEEHSYCLDGKCPLQMIKGIHNHRPKESDNNLLKTWRKDLKQWSKATGVTWLELESSVEELLEAQRKRDAEIVENMFGWLVTPYQTTNPYGDYLYEKVKKAQNETLDKILNQNNHD